MRRPGLAADVPGLHAMSFPGTTRIAGWLFWMVFPALSVVSIVYASITLADHVGQASSSVRGTFTVQQRDCDDHLCTVTGTFVSDDGFLSYAEVPGDSRWKSDTSHVAYFSRGMYEADADAQSWDPTTAVLALAGGLIYLVVVGWLGTAALRERTASRARTLSEEANRTVQSG